MSNYSFNIDKKFIKKIENGKNPLNDLNRKIFEGENVLLSIKPQEYLLMKFKGIKSKYRYNHQDLNSIIDEESCLEFLGENILKFTKLGGLDLLVPSIYSPVNDNEFPKLKFFKKNNSEENSSFKSKNSKNINIYVGEEEIQKQLANNVDNQYLEKYITKYLRNEATNLQIHKRPQGKKSFFTLFKQKQDLEEKIIKQVYDTLEEEVPIENIVFIGSKNDAVFLKTKKLGNKEKEYNYSNTDYDMTKILRIAKNNLGEFEDENNFILPTSQFKNDLENQKYLYEPKIVTTNYDKTFNYLERQKFVKSFLPLIRKMYRDSFDFKSLKN